ncbi:hypothetical protein INN84_16585, partial [Staphylococcus aureus]|nr:hypothetical protein [Staphylococcus aureus]
IFVEDVIESLPEHVDTIIDIKSRTEGELITKEKELVQLKFTPKGTAIVLYVSFCLHRLTTSS